MARPLSSNVKLTSSAARTEQIARGLVLVFGNRGLAELIGRELRGAGFDTELLAASGKRLPAPTEEGALDVLRTLLKDFGSRGQLIHPGLSQWADRPELITIAADCGLSVISPPLKDVNFFTNRLTLLGEGEALGIPNLLLSPDPMYTVREVEALMESQGLRFPFVLKAVRGTGAPNHTVVQEPQDFEKKLPLWFEQLRRNTGDVMFFPEKYLEGARQLLVPFARFADGRVEIFPSVDSSLRCQHRPVIEFCPASGVEAGVERQIVAWTEALAKRSGYVGVGALEFLVDARRAFLIDGHARLTSSFRLWDQIAGTSAVAWQLATQLLSDEAPRISRPPVGRSFGVALHLYAEDSLLHLPQPGWVQETSERRGWVFPGAEAELSLGIDSGSYVSPAEDGYLGNLVVWAQDRRQAITVARGALEEVWIAGSLQTNERFLAELLVHPWVREGIFHAGFVDEEFLPEIRPSEEWFKVLGSVAAGMVGPAPNARWAVGDAWVKPEPETLHWVEGPRRWERAGLPGISGRLGMSDGSTARVCAFPMREDKWQVRLGAWCLSVRKILSKAQAKSQARTSEPKPLQLLSLVAGRVHSILYQEGARVPAHEYAVLIESLGMLVPHALPVETTVLQWKVTADDLVESGQELASLTRA